MASAAAKSSTRKTTKKAAPRRLRLVPVDGNLTEQELDEVYLDEIEKWAETLPIEFLRCRELGHNWAPHTGTIGKVYGAIHRVLRCPRCKTRKHQDLARTGRGRFGVQRTWYSHPEGYLHQGFGQVTGTARDIIRYQSTTQGFKLRVVDDTGDDEE